MSPPDHRSRSRRNRLGTMSDIRQGENRRRFRGGRIVLVRCPGIHSRRELRQVVSKNLGLHGKVVRAAGIEDDGTHGLLRIGGTCHDCENLQPRHVRTVAGADHEDAEASWRYAAL